MPQSEIDNQEPKKPALSRREFLSLGGRLLGAAALGYAGSRLLSRNENVLTQFCGKRECSGCAASSLCREFKNG